MKKILLFLGFAALSVTNAQTTIFQENWDGLGPGITGWTLYNVDNLTPAGPTGTDGEALSYLVQDAWNVLTLAQVQTAVGDPAFQYPAGATGMAGNIAASNSWYNPAGTANDWLVSPQITIPAGSTSVNLSWAATSRGAPSWLEDYKVYISTAGNQVADFTTLLLNVPNELNTGSYRTVDLSAYAGQNVYIAFRNDGVDQYVMFLDNISITANVLSTNEVSQSDFGVNVYPNPTTDFLTVESKTRISEVQIFDMAGRTIKTDMVDGKVDVRALEKGNYILTLKNENGTVSSKFIKK